MIKIKNPNLKQSYAKLNTGDIIKHQIYGIGIVKKNIKASWHSIQKWNMENIYAYIRLF